MGVEDQGANFTFPDPLGLQIGLTVSMKNTVRMLNHMFDGIEFCGAGPEMVETLQDFVNATFTAA